MSDKVDLRVDWCSYEAAKYAVEHWHYSKRMPKSKQVYIGVWENGNFIGVIIFGISVTPYLGDAYGLNYTECAELTRVALNSHASPVSRIVSIALKMIKRQSPGLRLIVSYADSNVGHTGGIYQAMNWIYCGKSASIRQYFYKKSWRNDAPMFREFSANPKLREVTEFRDLEPKHKYLFPLDDAMRQQILPLAKPYPKRDTCGRGEIDNAPQSNEETGGASPTRPLNE